MFQAGQQQAGEPVSGGGGGLQNLLLAEGLGQDAGGHVGHQGEAQDLHPAVSGDDDLRGRGHAYRVSAQETGHAHLGGGLILRTGEVAVNALLQADVQPPGLPPGQVLERGKKLANTDEGFNPPRSDRPDRRDRRDRGDRRNGDNRRRNDRGERAERSERTERVEGEK